MTTKWFTAFWLLVALVMTADALSPMLGQIYDPAVSVCTASKKTCSGRSVCFSSSSVGPCCGGCDSTYCRACRGGYACTGGGCTSIWIIIVGCLVGLAILCALISYFLKRRYYTSSGSSTIVVATPGPVYEETTVVTQVAPPPQQVYVPDTYVSTTTVVGQPQAVVTYPANQYGAPAGATYVTSTTHEAY